MEDRIIQIKNSNIHYKVWGNKKNPPLVFLHGAGGPYKLTKLRDKKIIEKFSKKFHVFAPDHPGFKQSKLIKNLEMCDYYDYVENFITRLKLKNIILVGQSFGSRLAAGYAIKNQTNVKLLVLGNPAIFFDIPDKKGFFYNKEKLVRFSTSKNIIKKTIKLIFGPEIYEKETETDYIKQLKNMKSEVNKSYILGLKKLNLQTIIFWGENDILISKMDAIKLNKQIKNSILISAKYSHFALVFETERLVRIISNNIRINKKFP